VRATCVKNTPIALPPDVRPTRSDSSNFRSRCEVLWIGTAISVFHIDIVSIWLPRDSANVDLRAIFSRSERQYPNFSGNIF
jgi:hypothetical protein